LFLASEEARMITGADQPMEQKGFGTLGPQSFEKSAEMRPFFANLMAMLLI
jgi:hypothetical protein